METKEFSFKEIKRKHKIISYFNDGERLLHNAQKFGYTDFSRQIDLNIIAQGHYVLVNDENDKKQVVKNTNNRFNVLFVTDENGNIVQKLTYDKIEGVELVLYDQNDNVTFDEWVYIFKRQGTWVFCDIEGHTLEGLL